MSPEGTRLLLPFLFECSKVIKEEVDKYCFIFKIYFHQSGINGKTALASRDCMHVPAHITFYCSFLHPFFVIEQPSFDFVSYVYVPKI